MKCPLGCDEEHEPIIVGGATIIPCPRVPERYMVNLGEWTSLVDAIAQDPWNPHRGDAKRARECALLVMHRELALP